MYIYINIDMEDKDKNKTKINKYTDKRMETRGIEFSGIFIMLQKDVEILILVYFKTHYRSIPYLLSGT